MIGPERAESESDKRRFDVKRYLPTALRPQDKTVSNLIFVQISTIWRLFLSFSATTKCFVGSSILCDEENRNDNHVFVGKSVDI